MSAARLYTPELLGLAVELADHPPLATGASTTAEARSPTCGSTLTLDLALTPEGRVAALGLRVQACAVGQAAAAIFARHALGRDGDALEEARRAIDAWLANGGDRPDWADLALLEPARAFSGRHGAILLPWRAATAALSSVGPKG